MEAAGVTESVAAVAKPSDAFDAGAAEAELVASEPVPEPVPEPEPETETAGRAVSAPFVPAGAAGCVG